MHFNTKANTLKIIKKSYNNIVPDFLFFKKKEFLKDKKKIFKKYKK